MMGLSREEYVIWKFKIPFGPNHRVTVPFGSLLLSVGAQGDSVVGWFLVNPKFKDTPKDYAFSVFSTGEKFKSILGRLSFAGTVKFEFQGYVYHVFTDAPMSEKG